MAPAGSKKKQGWKLDCWCFSPGLGMQDIVDHGVHSIILTSGTLSPLGPMVSELGVNFPVQLENPHIIEDNQVFVAVVANGPDGTPLNSSYQNRSNERYINSLGRTLTNFSRLVPDGLLVFFPSYSVMKTNIGKWEENGIWQNLSGMKPVFIEPQGKDAFQESIEAYYSAIKEPNSKGATLLAVCRGKVSEGLDFADKNARAVVITGLPFAPSMDPRVKMKMQYLDSLAKENKGLYGNDWYVLQASRAVNQAIGRVIRHKDDFGAILLCDDRFKQVRIQNQLSKWIHGHVHVFDSFGPVLKQLSSFFKALDKEPLKSKFDTKMGGFQLGSTVINPGHLNMKDTSQENQKTEFCESINGENIFESYKINDRGLSVKKENNSSSIFDMMENNSQVTSCAQISKSVMKCGSPISETSTDPVPSTSKAKPKDAKRRKISISFRQAHQPDSEKSAEMWKTFLMEIKTLLGATENYGKFCSAIREFKANKNVENFATNMKMIFSGIPDKNKYLQTASLLVGSQNRELFLAVCS
ncbi:Regulator of telomere elongation helicase 1-like protein, partial [Stegodyphus mimosarum]